MAALLAELNQIELRSQPKKAPAPPVSKLFASAHSVRAPPRAPTGINDLPDEALLRIFGFLDDQLGYRALPSLAAGSPQWSFPPLRVARVCKRWLPLSRHLFYRSVRIAHLSRIPALHRAQTLNPDLSTHVRHFVIHLPSVLREDLEQVLPIRRDLATGGGEADSDPDPQSRPPSASSLPGATTTKKAKKGPPLVTYADQLRAIFQSCAFLLSLEISGIPPATLFAASSSTATSSLHRLHQLRLSTVESLTLSAADDAEPLQAIALRDALLALTGLRRLTLKGYGSSTHVAEQLNFAPTSTWNGLSARPLPARTRSMRLLPLDSLALLECSFSPSDLEALLRYCRPRTLRRLIVEDRYTSARAQKLRELGFANAPTVESLSHVVNLVQDSLVELKISLYNYPLLGRSAATGMWAADASGRVSNAQHLASRTSESRPRRAAQPPHVLDDFVSRLRHLKFLDVGGTVLTSTLFTPLTASSSQRSALPRLPPSVHTLTIRACPDLTPPALLPFLDSLGPLPSRLADPTESASHLSELTTLGGSEHGWSRPTSAWAVQQACWRAGVKWSSGASNAPVTVQADTPAHWAHGYGPGSRTGGAW
ncbi:hypothetical protein JCM8202v2_000931 [Rhodotorula sphaerocarpa]